MLPLLLALGVVVAANAAPLIATSALGQRFTLPVDLGCRFADGERLFGPAKTVRGILAAVLFGGLAALALGIPPALGALAGLAAMCGDLVSSFVKRRLGMASSSRFLGVDQIPEALFPVLVLAPHLGYGLAGGIAVVAAFAVLSPPASWLLHHLKVRQQPY